MGGFLLGFGYAVGRVGRVGIIVLSWLTTGWIRLSTTDGKMPMKISVPAMMKIGTRMRFGSFIAVSSVAFLP